MLELCVLHFLRVYNIFFTSKGHIYTTIVNVGEAFLWIFSPSMMGFWRIVSVLDSAWVSKFKGGG